MSKPDYVYIGGYKFEIDYTSQEAMESPRQYRHVVQDDMLGETNCLTLTIRINADLPDPLQRASLLHEMLHCIHEYGMTAPIQALLTADDKDEAFASMLERALWMVIADERNQPVWTWLLGINMEEHNAVDEEGRKQAYQEGTYPEAEAHVG